MADGNGGNMGHGNPLGMPYSSMQGGGQPGEGQQHPYNMNPQQQAAHVRHAQLQQQHSLNVLNAQLDQFWNDQIKEVSSDTTDFKNHHLPLARIKKIMKSDEDVRMISAEAPVLFAKACEMFILELTLRAWAQTEEAKRRTLQRSDISAAIERTDIFDFLIDIVPREEKKEDIPRQPQQLNHNDPQMNAYYMPPQFHHPGADGMQQYQNMPQQGSQQQQNHSQMPYPNQQQGQNQQGYRGGGNFNNNVQFQGQPMMNPQGYMNVPPNMGQYGMQFPGQFNMGQDMQGQLHNQQPPSNH